MVYFNEIDAFAAQWLRNHWPNSHVEERSICDVSSSELSGHDRVHFFAGIGGWETALDLAGWPKALQVFTGSCPCQPFSAAGKRKGEADERHLWPEFRRLIAECLPPTVFGEQVASADGRLWLSGVRADLEALGYAVGAADLCAAGLGAPHIRQRLFWVAYRGGEGLAGRAIEHARPKREAAQRSGDAGGLSDAGPSPSRTSGRPARDPSPERAEAPNEPSGYGADSCGLSNTENSNGRDERIATEKRRGKGPQAGGHRPNHGLEHASGDGRNARRAESDGRGVASGCGDSRLANSHGNDTGGGELRLQPNRRGCNGDSSIEERTDPWIDFVIVPCADGKFRRLKSGLVPLAHGIPRRIGPLVARLVELGHSPKDAKRIVAEAKRNRIGQLKGYGNAIVATLAAEFIRAFMETEGK